MYILIVEDDYQQADFIRDSLLSAYPNGRVDLIQTEAEFRSSLNAIEKQPPDVVVLDGMLRWTDPSEKMEPRPEDVKSGGIFEAGLRCKELLKARETTRRIPVILYTVLERADLGSKAQGALHLSKEAEPEALINAVRVLAKAAG